NYRDAQKTYFASAGGLERVRELLRADQFGTITPDKLPGVDAKAVIYVLNPNGGETVEPWNPKNMYFDYELCHEFNSELGIGDPNGKQGSTLPCTVDIPAGKYTTVNLKTLITNASELSQMQNMNFKWVRITMKTNYSTPYKVDQTATDDAQVCWDNDDFKQKQ